MQGFPKKVLSNTGSDKSTRWSRLQGVRKDKIVKCFPQNRVSQLTFEVSKHLWFKSVSGYERYDKFYKVICKNKMSSISKIKKFKKSILEG